YNPQCTKIPSFAWSYHAGSSCRSSDSIVAWYFCGACADAALRHKSPPQHNAVNATPASPLSKNLAADRFKSHPITILHRAKKKAYIGTTRRLGDYGKPALRFPVSKIQPSIFPLRRSLLHHSAFISTFLPSSQKFLQNFSCTGKTK